MVKEAEESLVTFCTSRVEIRDFASTLICSHVTLSFVKKHNVRSSLCAEVTTLRSCQPPGSMTSILAPVMSSSNLLKRTFDHADAHNDTRSSDIVLEPKEGHCETLHSTNPQPQHLATMTDPDYLHVHLSNTAFTATGSSAPQLAASIEREKSTSKRRKLTLDEQEARRLDKEEKDRERAEEKVKKEAEREDKRKIKESQMKSKEEERRKKEEEKSKKEKVCITCFQNTAAD